MAFPSAAERSFFTLHSSFFTYFLPLFLHPIIIVLHNHQHVATLQFLFPIKHHVADALVKDVGALVATSHHNGIVKSYMMIAVAKSLDEFCTRHLPDIRETGETDFRQLGNVIMGNHLADAGSIKEDARLLTLTDYFVQIALINRQSIPLEHRSRKGW